MADDD